MVRGHAPRLKLSRGVTQGATPPEEYPRLEALEATQLTLSLVEPVAKNRTRRVPAGRSLRPQDPVRMRRSDTETENSDFA